MTQRNPSVESNELVQLLTALRTETYKPAAITISKIAKKYGIPGLECVALIHGGSHLVDVRDFLVTNAGIDPLTIPVV